MHKQTIKSILKTADTAEVGADTKRKRRVEWKSQKVVVFQ
jgi:adenylosuccinate synthase